MADLPHAWRVYARIQQQLSNCAALSQRAWGLEAALNELLSYQPQLSESELSRTIASAERRHRYRHAQLQRYAEQDHEEASLADPIAEALDADQILQRIRGAVADPDWLVLNALAEGESYKVLADELGTSSGALRVRISRARKQLAGLAA